MIRKIYHGSTRIVRTPEFGEGRQYNDFGLGFYCTEYPQYAAEWAAGMDRNGFVSAYGIESDGLRIINLCGPQYNPLHWLSLLFDYREFDFFSPVSRSSREYISKYFSVDHQGCDCIAGYRADNSCFMFAQEFLDGRLSYQALKSALTSDLSSRQFVLKSNRAFDRIRFDGYETALCHECYPPKAARELRFIRSIHSRRFKDELFVTDLIDQEVRPYDTRL